MRRGIVELAPFIYRQEAEQTFEKAFKAKDISILPESLPKWVFLEWLSKRGWLFHGSNHPDIRSFEPRTPNDLTPDAFSKRTAVFASSDAIWAMMYALTARDQVTRILNMAFRVLTDNGWSRTQYFLSLAPKAPDVINGRSLLRDGNVYVFSREGFEQMPAYEWPGLGTVLEPQWATSLAVSPMMNIPVLPEDFPLPVRLHDAGKIDALAQSDPWGFPWLDPETLAKNE